MSDYDPHQVASFIPNEEITRRLDQVASQIAHDYHRRRVILVGVLKGSFMVLADLIKLLWEQGLTDCVVDFMGISSYGSDTESSKNPKITKDLDMNIEGRHVLIIEDIVDTGYSLDALLRLLKERHPASLKTFVLLSKASRREIEVPLEYVGFEVEGWVEGYGLDTAELFRGRPEIVVRTG